jgi:transcriptional regulator with XRE-family HTH domain
MMTPPQSRAARALLGWSQEELAAAAHVSVGTVRHFESGKTVPMYNTLAGMQRALEDAGVLFIAENGDGPGVKLRKTR